MRLVQDNERALLMEKAKGIAWGLPNHRQDGSGILNILGESKKRPRVGKTLIVSLELEETFKRPLCLTDYLLLFRLLEPRTLLWTQRQ